MAFEEDTFLVMSAESRIRPPREPLMKIMTRVIEMKPQVPGSVLVKKGRPMRFLAVVHDLNADPTWKEEWVAEALLGIFKEAEKRRCRSIGIPFLGTLHGSLEKERFLKLFKETVNQVSSKYPESIWLVMPDGTKAGILDILNPA